MLSSNDPFFNKFKGTFEANYNPATFQNEDSNPIPDCSPVSFYDRHIASNLVLKNVVYLPSLSQLLSKRFDRAVQSFLQAGYQFSLSGYNAFPLKCQAKTFTDANDVLFHYHVCMANLCPRYATKLVLHPHSSGWDSVFRAALKAGESYPNFAAESWLTIDPLLKDQTFFDDLEQATKQQIQSLEQKFSRLATWDVFAMTETATKMFQQLTRSITFSWETCHTLGHWGISHLPVPPDARKSLVNVYSSSRSKVFRSGRRPTAKASNIVVVPRLPPRRRSYRPELRHYIQHAWATAAVHDSTFFILHCGRYERIGFRHRGSQTLYLSGVIDTINAHNPSYRKIHAGLYVAILQDALDRLELLDSQVKKEKVTNLKRPAEDSVHKDMPSPKRQKTTLLPVPVDAISNTKLLSDEIAVRRLAIIRLEYGAYCSPIPCSFVRIGPTCLPGFAPRRVTKAEKEHPKQTHFKVHERFELTLKEPLGRGSVGVVHPAIAELALASGETLKHPLVVKLAFSHEQQKGMKNEYRIYGHLSRKDGVQGIPTVHGMFRDPELDILAMVMSDAGRSLRDYEIELGQKGRKVSEVQRKAFIDALTGLHRAGVRHNDIRPENLLINSEGQVSIIDFDRADFNVADRLLKGELSQLNEVLDGRF